MNDGNQQSLRKLTGSIAELSHLVEFSHAIQEEIRKFRERYDRIGRDAPLPPKSLRALRQGRRRYLNLQNRLAVLAKRYASLADEGAGKTADSLLRFQGLSVSLLAAVTLYDNYLSMLTILKDDHLRRLLDNPDYGYGIEEGALMETVERLNSTEARATLHRLLDAWSEANGRTAADGTSSLLRSAIESSVSYRYAREASLADHLPDRWHFLRARFMDAMDGLAEESLGAISKAFGNGIGLVELRKGKLYGNPAVRKDLLDTLKPLDLLLEKTPFRLTDYFIPGHFGHVAIWMGSDAGLDALGLWAQPEMQDVSLKRCRDQIRTGHSVLEALRTGVELNTLEDFLNVDDVVVLRPKGLTQSQTIESLIRGFRQIGKEYDFNFDVETTGAIVCSELPYHVYPGVAWKTSSQLGRFTISPDQVASQALSDSGAFDLVVFYHDGKLVDAGSAHPRMRSLMRED